MDLTFVKIILTVLFIVFIMLCIPELRKTTYFAFTNKEFKRFFGGEKVKADIIPFPNKTDKVSNETDNESDVDEEYEYYQALKEEYGLSDNYANWDWRVRYCDIIEYDEITGYMLVSVPDTSRSDPSCKVYSIAKGDADVAPKSAIHEYTDFDYIERVESDINVDKNEALNVFHKFLKSHTEVDS